ncbi:TetR/AcrR family transcriptional regulator [Frondihabitans australicus]|uniref:TetR family transcriptional regulator n=1 Tax=Frondihabitans australicus TaxID=386892 RepID=A0A495III1_9MICO|nr:TetR/AcrR family transcriptional regulator [Frondihabitans australicus]RKR75793.1 TetR family transcriptional regulator [Frondihabitans australicus]
MPRRSDAKQKMVDAAQALIRERGVTATAVSDVLERSGAPRGSVYFHFPGGKNQLVIEAAESHAHAQVEIIDSLAAAATTPAELVSAYLEAGRAGMIESGFGRGCGIAPLVTEGEHGDEQVTDTARRGFTEMADRLSHHLVSYGLGRQSARSLADAVLAAAEGALIMSRALRSDASWTTSRDSLVAYARGLSGVR